MKTEETIQEELTALTETRAVLLLSPYKYRDAIQYANDQIRTLEWVLRD